MAVDYARLAQEGASAAELAEAFLCDYHGGRAPAVPVNPFQILRDVGVVFSFRNFSNYEGVYIPSESEGDIPVVGINANRPITRQRYTAAHELCHHIKDADMGFACEPGSRSDIERYAENFAAELLMPRRILLDQVSRYAVNGFVSFEDALRIADYFGVSFAACINQLAFDLHVIDGDVSPGALRQRRNDFGPLAKRAELGMSELDLYRQLYNSAEPFLRVYPSPQTCQMFEAEYVFHDSRMEGVSIDREQAAEAVVDLRTKGPKSALFGVKDKNVIEVAGLATVYERVFEKAAKSDALSIYDATEINKTLFSFANYPEGGGEYRGANALVLGGRFETPDYRRVPEEMYWRGKEIDCLVSEGSSLSASEYIEKVLDIHHDLTVIHPYRDGNGRSLRAFANLLLLKRCFPPVLFSGEEKDAYKDALGKADATGDRAHLFELYYREMLKSHAMFTGSLL